jgi:hypothetical protein
LAKRLHELVVQSVKIVEQADMVMVVKHANPGSIVPLLWTITQPVLPAVLEDINLTVDKQAVFRVRQESTNILREQKHVWTVKLDNRRTLPGAMHQSVAHV